MKSKMRDTFFSLIAGTQGEARSLVHESWIQVVKQASVYKETHADEFGE